MLFISPPFLFFTSKQKTLSALWICQYLCFLTLLNFSNTNWISKSKAADLLSSPRLLRNMTFPHRNNVFRTVGNTLADSLHSHSNNQSQTFVLTVQYSTVQYSTVRYSTVQYSTVRYTSTVRYDSTVRYNSTVRYDSTVRYNSTVRYDSTVR